MLSQCLKLCCTAAALPTRPLPSLQGALAARCCLVLLLFLLLALPLLHGQVLPQHLHQRCLQLLTARRTPARFLLQHRLGFILQIHSHCWLLSTA
jgi:hypothetical protein